MVQTNVVGSGSGWQLDLHSERFILYACILSDLTIERFCMTGGKSPVDYLKAYMTNLYLSKDAEKVTEAIEQGG